MKAKIIYFAVVSLFVFFLLRNLNEGQKLLEIVFSARWWFAAGALTLQLLRFGLVGKIYQKSLSLFGTEWKLSDIIPLSFASQAINIFAPFAPFPGSSVFIKKARTENIPSLNIAASMLFMSFIDYLALVPFLLTSLVLQFIYHSVFIYEIVGIFVFFFITACLFLFLLIGIISPKVLTVMFQILEMVVNKVHFLFKKRNYFIKDWSEKRTSQFTKLSARLLTLEKKKRKILALAIIRHLMDMFSFYLLFLAFGINLPLVILSIGYSLMVLFSIVSPTPQGTGFVEVIILAIFKSLDMAAGPATLAILAFRGLNLWLTAVIGYLFLHGFVNGKKT